MFFSYRFLLAILKEKISESLIQNVTAFSISFFYTSSPSSTFVADQMKNTLNTALTNSKTRLAQGDKPFIIAKDLYSAYSNQKVLVSLNGYNLSQSSSGNESYFVNPKTYEVKSKQLLAGGYTEFYSALASMKAGEIKTVVASEGIGGNVIKVISVNSGSYANYEDFLSKQRKSLLTVIVSL